MTSGTGTKAQIGCPAAGKTGTTDEHGDAWFVGYTPRLSTAVWVGYPQARVPMLTEYHGARVAGGTYPAEIWGDYMREAKGGACGDFPTPDTPPEWVPFSGKYANSGGDGTGPGAPEDSIVPEVPDDSAPDEDSGRERDRDRDRPEPDGGGTEDGGAVDPGDYQSPADGGGVAAPDGT
jgi:penicillin-binding protein 1A